MSGPALAVIENPRKPHRAGAEQMAARRLPGFCPSSSDKAPFIWAALSLYWAQMASLIPAQSPREYGEARQYCPVFDAGLQHGADGTTQVALSAL